MPGSVFQRGPNNYAAIVYCGVDPKTGKERHKWTGGFKTEDEARAHLAMIAKHPAMGAGVGPFGSSRLRFGDYLEQWLEANPVSAHEQRNRQYDLRRHVIPVLGHVPLARLHPVTIQEFFVRRRKAGRNQTTENRIFRVLRAALNHGVRMGLIAANPCNHVIAPQPEPYTPILWTDEEVGRFLDAARSSRYFSVYLAAMGTGLRAGELLALLWRNVDMKCQVAYITHVLERPAGGGFVLREFPKSSHSRRPVRLPEALLAHLATMRRENLGLVFCNKWGQPVHHRRLSVDFHKVMTRAKVPAIHFHDLRHLHGSMLAANGVSPKEIQERLGHSTPAFTLARYIHTPADLQRASAGLADRWLRLSGDKGTVPGSIPGPADAANGLQTTSALSAAQTRRAYAH